MKKVLGLCAILALITCGVVHSDEVKSLVEQNVASDAVQAVESAVEDAIAQPMQEALPEQDALPEQSGAQVQLNTDEDAEPEIIETPQPQPEETVQTPQLNANTQYIWGIITSPIPSMVRAQVNLPEEYGLFVQTIKPNGPAAKAGILPYDIIVSVDGVAVSNTGDLSAEIQKAAGKPQKLTVLRHGKELTVNITAQPSDSPRQPFSVLRGTPSPAPQQLFIDPMSPNYDPNADDEDYAPAFPNVQNFLELQRQQLENMRQRMEAMENAMRQRMPGALPFVPPAQTPVPGPNTPPMKFNAPNPNMQCDSFSVQVQKNGNEPAIIKIQENGNEYIVDENSIDQLPENVRNRLNFKIKTNDK